MLIENDTGKDSCIKTSRPTIDCSLSTQRGGLTILELLVTIGIISALIALLLPAVMFARESARRVECTSHLRQLGLALHSYHDVYACLPPAWLNDSTARSGYGWGVSLLPFIDQHAIFLAINKQFPVGDHQLDSIHGVSLSLFLCPSDVAPATFDVADPGTGVSYLTLPSANYVGVYGTSEPDEIQPPPAGNGTFRSTKPIRFSEVTHGLSNTFIVGERSAAAFSSSWLGFDYRDEDAECRVLGSAITGPNCRQCDECEFGSRHAGVAEFLFGDGHVRGISNSVDAKVYRQMARRQE